MGEGDGFPADRFVVSVHPQEPPRLVHVDGDPQAPSRWSLRELSPAAGYLGALAVEEHDPVVSTWSWEDVR